jgi:truncated hemoglobin YjbI
MATVEATTLYDKLGGKPAIKKMADILADKLAKDPTLGPYFE